MSRSTHMLRLSLFLVVAVLVVSACVGVADQRVERRRQRAAARHHSHRVVSLVDLNDRVEDGRGNEESGSLSVSSKDDDSEESGSEESGSEESGSEESGKAEHTGNSQVAQLPRTTAKSIMLSNYNRIEDIDPKKRKNKGLRLAEEAKKRFSEEMLKKKKGESNAKILEEQAKADRKHREDVARKLEQKNKATLAEVLRKKMKEEAQKKYQKDEEAAKKEKNRIKKEEQGQKAKLKADEAKHKADEKHKAEEFRKSQQRQKKKFAEEMSKRKRKVEQQRKHAQRKHEQAHKHEQKVKRTMFRSRWKAYGGTYMQPRVDKWGKMCLLTGLVRGERGLVGVLPTDCRPKGRLVFNVNKGGMDARVDVIPDGRVIVIAYTGHQWLSLDGISFATANLQSVVLVSGWRNYGGSYRPAGAHRQGSLVMLSGMIRSGRWGYFGRLLGNMRPHGRLVFSANNHKHVTRVDVLSNGFFLRAGGSHNHQWVSLDGIIFSKHGGAGLNLHNGWHAFGHGYRSAKFRRVGRVCVLSGLIRNDHRNWHKKAHIGTLPRSCRPRKRLIMHGNVNMRSARIDIIDDGRIFYISGRMSHPWMSLSNIAFIAK